MPYPDPSQQAVHANVWAEHAPPRLDASTVTHLQASFRSNYPGEHLDSDCMPSIRLLSLVHMWFKPGGTIKWVPWQKRLSSKQYQDIIEARTSRTLRTEAQLISTALFDETPELPVEHICLNAPWLASKQAVFRNAIALCSGAHLSVLKAFDKKALDLCTQSLPASSGLRAANTQELLQADRTLWNEIAKLVAEGWTLDEALHEFTCIRADVRLLQPRAPSAAKAPLPRLFLDLFAGIHAPLTAAVDALGLDTFEPFDLDANASHDVGQRHVPPFAPRSFQWHSRRGLVCAALQALQRAQAPQARTESPSHARAYGRSPWTPPGRWTKARLMRGPASSCVPCVKQPGALEWSSLPRQ